MSTKNIKKILFLFERMLSTSRFCYVLIYWNHREQLDVIAAIECSATKGLPFGYYF